MEIPYADVRRGAKTIPVRKAGAELFIALRASADGLRLLPRDAKRYCNYFPGCEIISS